MTAEIGLEDIEIDIDALDRKYAEERAKRLRNDAVNQYQELKGKFAGFDQDPHANPDFTRDPVVEDADVLIIGGGFAGLLVGGHLRQAGIKDIRIVDKAADFGGCWYWNRYPGASCDVESYIYLPLLEEMGYLPTEKYIKAPEIFEHSRMLGKHFDLYRGALFQTAVTGARWEAARKRWIVATDRNDEIAARFLISCNGFLSNPKLPGIPGIESFEGHAFHTSRWDYAYTGGDVDGNLTGLADKVVGIIGTGATGVQVIPHLGASAKRLYVFQRTPSSVDERNNRPTDPALLRDLTPGWTRKRRDNFTELTSGIPVEVDYVDDGWTDIIRHMASPTGSEGDGPADPEALRIAEMKKMEMVRRRIESIVQDPETAEALKPYYNYFCKRPCFHDEYLPTFNRPNVKLVDTHGIGVERITPKGVVVEGTEYPLDCLIFATGFDFLTEFCRESGIDLVGEGGMRLSKHWEEGPRTLFGMQTHGFPNFFFTGLAQAGTSINYVHVADEQTKHIAYVIEQCLARGSDKVQPTQEAEDGWVGEIIAGSGPRRSFLESCTPGYYNYEGKRKRSVELSELYGDGPIAYMRRLEEWQNDDKLAGLELSPATAPAA